MRFGIISTAGIATGALIPAIQASDHDVVALASRDADRAESVASDFGIPRSYGSYEELLADDDLDAVYNPLPNGLHAHWSKKAADAGLHVLCEKPIATDASEARELFDYCADRDVTVMEAFMYRFHPRTERAVELVERELGDVRSVTASFSFPLDDRDDVRFNPDLAGGSTMDVGCYAISAARLFLGDPDRVYAHTTDSRDVGVDTGMSAIFEYDSGEAAQVRSSFDVTKSQFYRVETTDGWLHVDPAFGADPDETVTLDYVIDGERTTETFEPVDHYRQQVDAFAEAVETGSEPRITPAESIGNMRVIDAVYESAAAGEPVDVEPAEGDANE